MSPAESILAAFSDEIKKKYGVLVCDLTVEAGEPPLIAGKVLIRKLLELLEKKFQEANIPVQFHVSVVVELAEPPLGYAYCDNVPTSVYRKPTKKDTVLLLTTQAYVKEDPLRLLWETEDHFCVQLIDNTVGWIRKSELTQINGEPNWQPPEQKACSAKEFAAYGQRWLGVPYLLGGTTQAGVDCSGLIQHMYRHCFNYLLPKHSMDQMKVGTAVKDYPKQGDLAFFHKEHTDGKIYGHVGIVLDANHDQILHASISGTRNVQISTLKDMISHGYQLLGYYRYPVEII